MSYRPLSRTPIPPSNFNNRLMGFIRRHPAVILLATLATLLLLFTQLKALPGEKEMASVAGQNAKLDLTGITPQTFKPEMIVGLYYVPDEEDPRYPVLVAEKKDFITAKQLPKKLRVIPEGFMVTMDWVEDRFNIYIKKEDHQIYKAKFG